MASADFFSITAGELAELLGVIGGAVAVVFHFGARARSIESVASEAKEDISELKSDIKKLGDILITLARQGDRMDMIDRRLDDIVHGRVRIFNQRGSS